MSSTHDDISRIKGLPNACPPRPKLYPLETIAMQIQSCFRFLLLIATIQNAVLSIATAADPVFSLTQSDAKIIVKVGDQIFAEYVLDDPATNKSYLWPVYGPTGKAMTRSFPMKEVEGEVTDHYHHRGIWFGHEDIGGADSWAEKKTFEKKGVIPPSNQERVDKLGSQKHRAIRSMSADDTQATIVSEIDYLGPDGKKSLTEVRSLVFRVEGKTRVIDVQQDFIASEGEVTFGDKKDAGLSIRVPSTVSVDSKKGGRIINSEGLTDKDAWSKRGRWCDYTGPVEEETLGVTILNHPSSFRHPTSWHVRTYGLFTANPFGTLDPESPNGPHTLKKGEKLELRHRFILHDSSFTSEDIEQAYKRYADAN